MTYVDLRSDVVTRPTPAMRAAMAAAEVGDDDVCEDPTVRSLEEETAGALGKEAALFVPSGCMGNEIAVAVQTSRGDVILAERTSHLVHVEAPSITGLMGRAFRLLDGDRGRIRPEDLSAAFAGGAGERPALASAETTHNWGSGSIYPVSQLEALGRETRARGAAFHLDGARIWNASAATGIPPATHAAAADTVMVCFSKGLGAPVGSAIAGSRALVDEARKARKWFGGSMRQAGIVAAGALHALRHHRDRLVEDHARARRLADAIEATPGLRLDASPIETNIVIAEVVDRHERLDAFLAGLRALGVLANPFAGPGKFRLVTHLDVDDAGIGRAVAAVRRSAGDSLRP